MPMAALLALTMCSFIATANEAVPAGLLPGMARDFGVSQGWAGQLVTLCALGSGLAAIPLTVALRGWRRRWVLLLSVGAFSVQCHHRLGVAFSVGVGGALHGGHRHRPGLEPVGGLRAAHGGAVAAGPRDGGGNGRHSAGPGAGRAAGGLVRRPGRLAHGVWHPGGHEPGAGGLGGASGARLSRPDGRAACADAPGMDDTRRAAGAGRGAGLDPGALHPVYLRRAVAGGVGTGRTGGCGPAGVRRGVAVRHWLHRRVGGPRPAPAGAGQPGGVRAGGAGLGAGRAAGGRRLRDAGVVGPEFRRRADAAADGVGGRGRRWGRGGAIDAGDGVQPGLRGRRRDGGVLLETAGAGALPQAILALLLLAWGLAWRARTHGFRPGRRGAAH